MGKRSGRISGICAARTRTGALVGHLGGMSAPSIFPLGRFASSTRMVVLLGRTRSWRPCEGSGMLAAADRDLTELKARRCECPHFREPRVLSIQQPWAWAIALGRKRVENRSWSTKYRGEVYIHASTKLDRDGLEWLRREVRLRPPGNLPSGAVVAVAELVDVITKRRSALFGKWFLGPYGFVLRNVQPLRRPIPTTGKLGLFRPSTSVVRCVKRQLTRGSPLDD